MTGRYDLNTVIEDWREQDAMAGRDPEGERLEASAERRYRAERPCAVGPDAWFYRGITVTSADSISKRKTA
jgi:hypothetical protein